MKFGNRLKPPYWVIKDGTEYWLEEGGVTSKQSEAEQHPTRQAAAADKKKWSLDPHRARIVRVVSRK